MKSFSLKVNLLLFTIGILGCKHPEPESYLIPEGFKGRVNIIFNQPNGASPLYDHGRRLYRVPASGILMTRFNDEYGFVNHQYYYADVNGNEKILPIFRHTFNKDGTIKWIIKNRFEVGIFLDGTSGEYGPQNIKYQEFIVSDSASLNSFFTPQYRNDFTNLLQKTLRTNFNVDTISSK